MNLDKFRKRLPTHPPTETASIRSRFQRAKAIKLTPPMAAPEVSAAPAEPTEPVETLQDTAGINPALELIPHQKVI